MARSAPVNAPFEWPNSSLSSNSAERLGQWTVTNGFGARRLRAWIARASTPFPVPLSPRSSTVASLPATADTVCKTARMAGSELDSTPASSPSEPARPHQRSINSASCFGVKGLAK